MWARDGEGNVSAGRGLAASSPQVAASRGSQPFPVLDGWGEGLLVLWGEGKQTVGSQSGPCSWQVLSYRFGGQIYD